MLLIDGPARTARAAEAASDLAARVHTSAGLEWALSLLGVALLVSVVSWHRALARAVTRRRPERPRLLRYPSVTVIRPVRGADVGAAENFAAALDTGYPGEVQTLFVFDEASDPGLPVAEEVVARHRRSGRPGRAEVLIAGTPPAGRTGKLNAMAVGAAHAEGTLIAFGDSDTRPDRHVLRVLVETLLQTEGAGSAFAPVLVNQPARAVGDAMYALMQNGLYSPLAAYAAGPRRELPFIMGQFMIFTREALRAIGGVETADGQLVDDMYLGRRVVEAGFKNITTTHPLHIETGGMSLREFIKVCRRWMTFSRTGLPLSFTWRQWLLGAEFFALAITLAVAIAAGAPIAAAIASVALLALGGGLLVLQRAYGGAPIPLRYLWTPWAFFLLMPAVYADVLLRRSVNWRGRVYQLDASATLGATARPIAAPARQASSASLGGPQRAPRSLGSFAPATHSTRNAS